MEIESKIVYQILVPYIIGLITIVAPISVSIISSLNTQYNSSKILGLFIKQRTTKCLASFIIIDIIALFLFIIRKPWESDWDLLNPIMEHSAFGLIVISSVASIYFLGRFIWTMIKFLSPKLFASYIISKLKKKNVTKRTTKFQLTLLNDKCTTHPDTTIGLVLTNYIIKNIEIKNKQELQRLSLIIPDIIRYMMEKEKLDSMNSLFFSYFIRDNMKLFDFEILWKLITITVRYQKMSVFSNYLSLASICSSNLLRTLPYETKRKNRFKNRNNFFYFNLWLFSYLLYKKEYFFYKIFFTRTKTL